MLHWIKICLIFVFWGFDLFNFSPQSMVFGQGNPNLNEVRKDGRTALIDASAWGRQDEIQELLNQGANVNGKGFNGETALMVAAGVGRRKIVERLLDAGADPQARDKSGRTAFNYAADSGYPEIASILAGTPNTKPNSATLPEFAKVILRVEFRADGTIGNIELIQGIGHGLDEQAIAAARQIKFRPAVSNGVAVSSHARVEYTFHMISDHNWRLVQQLGGVNPIQNQDGKNQVGELPQKVGNQTPSGNLPQAKTSATSDFQKEMTPPLLDEALKAPEKVTTLGSVDISVILNACQPLN